MKDQAKIIEKLKKSDEPVLIIRTKNDITSKKFAKALAEHFFLLRSKFPDNLTKKEAKKILKTRLFHYGISGELNYDYFSNRMVETGERYEDLYELSLSWVKNNYGVFKDN